MSREIDILIGKHIFKYYITTTHTAHVNAPLVFDPPPGIKRTNGEVGRVFALPNYSTSIEDAWKVIENLDQPCVARHYDKWICTNLGSDFWYAVDCTPKQIEEEFTDGTYIAAAETPAMAICLAALALKRIEVPNE